MSISGVTRTTLVALAAAAVLTTAPAQAGQTPLRRYLDRGADRRHVLDDDPCPGVMRTPTSRRPCPADRLTPLGWPASPSCRPRWTGRASKRAVFRVVAHKCAPKLNQVLGRTDAARDTTAYQYYWFEPTKAQKSAGARWVSCSIILQRGAKLADLPNNRTPMIPRGKHDDTIARCLTKSVFNTPCASRHAWRATGTFTLDAAKRPATKSLNKTATRRCVRHVDPHKFYRFTYQDADSWAAGDHTVVCYTRTNT